MNRKQKDRYNKAIEKYGVKVLKQAIKVADLINKFPEAHRCCATHTAVMAIIVNIDQSGHQATGALMEAILKMWKPTIQMFDMNEMFKEMRRMRAHKPKKDKSKMVV